MAYNVEIYDFIWNLFWNFRYGAKCPEAFEKFHKVARLSFMMYSYKHEQ